MKSEMSNNNIFSCSFYGPEFIFSKVTDSFLKYVYAHSPHTWEAVNKTECSRSETQLLKFVHLFIFLSHAVATDDSLSSQKYGPFCPRAQPENHPAENYEGQLCFVPMCVFVYVEIQGETQDGKKVTLKFYASVSQIGKSLLCGEGDAVRIKVKRKINLKKYIDFIIARFCTYC